MNAREKLVIGNTTLLGSLPWHLPEDLRHFKSLTIHKTVIMGRRTFDSIGKPLPHRHNIVVSRTPRAPTENCIWVTQLSDAIANAATDDIFIIGGGEIYRQALALALVQRQYITEIDLTVADGDTFFPNDYLDKKQWALAEQSIHTDTNPHYVINCYERREI